MRESLKENNDKAFSVLRNRNSNNLKFIKTDQSLWCNHSKELKHFCVKDDEDIKKVFCFMNFAG